MLGPRPTLSSPLHIEPTLRPKGVEVMAQGLKSGCEGRKGGGPHVPPSAYHRARNGRHSDHLLCPLERKRGHTFFSTPKLKILHYTWLTGLVCTLTHVLCAHMSMWAHVESRGNDIRRPAQSVCLISLRFFESLSLERGSQSATPTSPFHKHTPGVTGTHSHTWLFTWMLEV